MGEANVEARILRRLKICQNYGIGYVEAMEEKDDLVRIHAQAIG
jgi:hypothetical protein